MSRWSMTGPDEPNNRFLCQKLPREDEWLRGVTYVAWREVVPNLHLTSTAAHGYPVILVTCRSEVGGKRDSTKEKVVPKVGAMRAVFGTLCAQITLDRHFADTAHVTDDHTSV